MSPEMGRAHAGLVLDEAGWSIWLGEQEGDLGALLRPPAEGAFWTLGPSARRSAAPREEAADLLDRII